MWRLWIGSFVCVAATAMAGAENVHLSDGTVVQGKIYRDGAGWTLILPNGNTRTLSSSDVVSIDLSSNSGELADQLASLRQSLQFTDNSIQAIARLENFIQRNPSSPSAKEAQKDLQIWRDRQQRHLVKIGNDWITPADADQLRKQATLLADHARQLIKAGDIPAANKLVNQIVALDPHNVPGLYLQGVLAYEASQLALAQKDFYAVAAIDPQHGPTMNNLAVLSFHTQHYAQCAGYYLAALQADPLRKQILDNVAELLHVFPAEAMDLAIVRSLHEEFARQDAELQQTLAKQNLSRWGARWITSDQLAQIQTAQKMMEEKVSALATQQQQLRASIAAFDQQIAANEQQQQTMAASSYAVNPTNGKMFYASFPQAYYDLERDNVDLKARRQTAAAKLEDVNAAIRSAQTQVPIQPYTGVQQIIGEEGTPITVPNEPTTHPAASQESTPIPTGSGNSLPL